MIPVGREVEERGVWARPGPEGALGAAGLGSRPLWVAARLGACMGKPGPKPCGKLGLNKSSPPAAVWCPLQ